ncbi:MAG: hypothetical protein M5R36_27580 [Deltaproteobacteria bacterium]|nr:hypothetical protein [Deltaproteobacteria bacterium]
MSSLGPIDAFDWGQVFIELDDHGPVGDDILINHSGATQSIRLSSVLRQIRWWSDTHPGHHPLVVGFQSGTSTDTPSMDLLRSLLTEHLKDASYVTGAGPLYSLEDYVEDKIAGLDSDTRDALRALSPNETALVLGYPTIEEIRGKILIEARGAQFDTQPAFSKPVRRASSRTTAKPFSATSTISPRRGSNSG